ncbi:hypothetical protein FACS189430_04110 [Bacteroidia bacterium]|nr:hypothetical protein FACS189430_04110 [Bacteroidia bacterium]
MALTKRMQLKIDNCKDLAEKVKNWETFDETDLEIIIKNLEKVPREEVSKLYFPYLTNEVAEKLLEIGEKYGNNTKMVCLIVSAFGNLITRYKVESTDKFYSFFRQCINQPKVDYFVAIHIDNFPQFNTSKDKWEYFFSILNIRPKNKSFPIFYTKIRRVLTKKEIIPDEYLEKIINVISEKYNNSNEWGKKDYGDTLEQLNKQKSV